MAKQFLDSTPAHGVSFRETAQEIDDIATPATREQRRTTGDHPSHPNAYECTDSGYSEGDSSEEGEEMITTNRCDVSQTPHGGDRIGSMD